MVSSQSYLAYEYTQIIHTHMLNLKSSTRARFEELLWTAHPVFPKSHLSLSSHHICLIHHQNNAVSLILLTPSSLPNNFGIIFSNFTDPIFSHHYYCPISSHYPSQAKQTKNELFMKIEQVTFQKTCAPFLLRLQSVPYTHPVS